MSLFSRLFFLGLLAVVPFLIAQGAYAQTAPPTATVPAQKVLYASPKVTPIDVIALKKLLKPDGKPLLINFWATWCDPCRDEFPDLVKVDSAFRGKIDFITISLDELSDINTFVPKFLGEMKAEMPAYLLHTPDEDQAISAVSKDWNGNLPLTILFSADGKTAYMRKGKVRYDALSAEIDKLLSIKANVP